MNNNNNLSPEEFKLRIAYCLIQRMIASNQMPGQIAKAVGLAKKRVEQLLDPSDLMLDLAALSKVCGHLGIPLRVRGGSGALTDADRSEAAALTLPRRTWRLRQPAAMQH